MNVEDDLQTNPFPKGFGSAVATSVELVYPSKSVYIFPVEKTPALLKIHYAFLLYCYVSRGL